MSFRDELGKKLLFFDGAMGTMLQERGFADRRKAGWRCLYQEHLCGMKHRLCDYVPEDAEEMSLDLFGFSQVLV